MSVLRRQVLKLIGGGIAATPGLAAGVPTLLAQASAVAATLPPLAQGVGQIQRSRLGPFLFNLMDETRLQYEAATWARRNARAAFGGFDPDIAAMRSWSAVTRCRKQMERDAEEALMLYKLGKAMWP